jgi:RNA polymerase sigma factor (sigma-70 family)
MSLIENYQPLIKNKAQSFSYKYGIDKDDLEQEGNLAIWKLQDSGTIREDNAAAVSSYIKLRVIGAMQEYVAKNVGPVAVPNNAFWQGGECAQVGNLEEIGDSINSDDPETLYLRKEGTKLWNEKVIAFINSLPERERSVFMFRIVADEPMSVRELADFIGVSSPQTVLNIEARVIEKAKGVFDDDAY